MRAYKLTRKGTIFEIVDETAFRKTLPGKTEPWINEDQPARRFYALCPYCENPIVIKGFHTIGAGNRHPHGAHLQKDVNGLGKYAPEAEAQCIYSSANLKKFGDHNWRRSKYAELSREVDHLVRTELDRVLYILSQDTGIIFSDSLITDMLKSYRSAQGFTYASAYKGNLPWAFADVLTSQSLYGREIKADSKLAAALKTSALLKLVPSDDGKTYRVLKAGNNFLEIKFEFNQLNFAAEHEPFEQTIVFHVFCSAAGSIDLHDLYKETLPIKYSRFQNLLKAERSKGLQDQQRHLIMLAAEILGPE